MSHRVFRTAELAILPHITTTFCMGRANGASAISVDIRNTVYTQTILDLYAISHYVILVPAMACGLLH